MNMRCCCEQEAAAYRTVLYPNHYSEAPGCNRRVSVVVPRAAQWRTHTCDGVCQWATRSESHRGALACRLWSTHWDWAHIVLIQCTKPLLTVLQKRRCISRVDRSYPPPTQNARPVDRGGAAPGPPDLSVKRLRGAPSRAGARLLHKLPLKVGPIVDQQLLPKRNRPRRHEGEGVVPGQVLHRPDVRLLIQHRVVMPVTAAAARPIVCGPRWANRRCHVAAVVAAAAAPAVPENVAVPKT